MWNEYNTVGVTLINFIILRDQVTEDTDKFRRKPLSSVCIQQAAGSLPCSPATWWPC